MVLVLVLLLRSLSRLRGLMKRVGTGTADRDGICGEIDCETPQIILRPKTST
jgi:hypothetical protein